MSKAVKKNAANEKDGRGSSLGMTNQSLAATNAAADPLEDHSWDELDSGMRAKLPGVRDLASLVSATAARRLDRAFLTAALDALPFFLEPRASPPLNATTITTATATATAAVPPLVQTQTPLSNTAASIAAAAPGNLSSASLASTAIAGGSTTAIAPGIPSNVASTPYLTHSSPIPLASQIPLSHFYGYLSQDYSTNDHRRGILLQNGLAGELLTVFSSTEIEMASRLRAAALLERIGQEKPALAQLKSLNAHTTLLQMLKEENAPEELFRAVNGLMSILTLDAEFATMLSNADGLQVYAEIIKSLTSSTAPAAYVIGRCGLLYPNRRKIRDMGALKLIHNLILAENNPELWTAGAHCIACHSFDAESREQFGSLGSIRYLVEFLHMEAPPNDLLQNTVLALSILSRHTKNQIRIIRFGAVEALVKLLSLHSPEIQMSSAITLANISSQEEGIQIMKLSGVFSACNSLMTSDSELLVAAGMRLLRAISTHADVREAIKRTEIIPVICRQLSSESKTLQQIAILTVVPVSYQHGENRLAFRKNGGLKSLVEILGTEIQSVKVHTILDTIGALLWEQESVTYFARHNGVQTLLSLLQNPDCTILALQILYRCCMSFESRDQLKKLGGYQTLASMVKSTNRAIARSSLQLVSVCCKEEEHAMEFCRLGVLDFTLEVLLSNAKDLFHDAREARDKIHSHNLSAKLFHMGKLDVCDITKTGFYDFGESTFIPPENITNTPINSRRETIMLDLAADTALDGILNDLKHKVESIKDINSIVALIASVVSETLGGRYDSPPSGMFTPDHTVDIDEEIKRCKNEAQSNTILIGQMRKGVTRHRAFMFKVLADRLGVDATLHRKVGGGGSRSWNTVLIGDDEFAVDVTNEIGSIYAVGSEEFSKYVEGI